MEVSPSSIDQYMVETARISSKQAKSPAQNGSQALARGSDEDWDGILGTGLHSKPVVCSPESGEKGSALTPMTSLAPGASDPEKERVGLHRRGSSMEGSISGSSGHEGQGRLGCWDMRWVSCSQF